MMAELEVIVGLVKELTELRMAHNTNVADINIRLEALEKNSQQAIINKQQEERAQILAIRQELAEANKKVEAFEKAATEEK